TTVENILPATCGMNALYAAFRALAERQATRGRTIWVQVGWLYLDTIALLKRHARQPADYVCFPNVFDLPALELLFAQSGSQIAGLIIEAPTNPLLQTADLAAIARLARSYEAAVLVDPSVSSVHSVDVMPHADVVTASLTKYAASEGDLTAGLVVVNPTSPGADALRRDIAARLEPVYPRDLSRLAHEIGNTRQVLRQIETSVPLIAAWLEAHPGVRSVAWAHSPKSRANYEKIERHPGAVGSMISFTVRQPIADFYDRLRLPKGPSFGIKTTLICPFIYLAHYDLVTTEAGRAELTASGLDPDLLRLSIGTEPAQDVITALAEALA
ncbi:MAG: Cystathionine gamma-synthase, partial [Verrucomicrobiota bacterium]